MVRALEVIAMSLQAAGADVRTASSGAAALEAWERAPADVLLCDLAMPGMDGFELLRRIRAIDARAGRTTTAVALTAHATDEYVGRTTAAGFARHLAKPYRAEDLVRVVTEVFARL